MGNWDGYLGWVSRLYTLVGLPGCIPWLGNCDLLLELVNGMD